jgi:amino-acid N-acetyltransferase
MGLPPGCSLSPACATDIWAIRRLVWSAKLDPTQLRWSQFWVIRCQDQIIACGQLRSFQAAQELGSLVVVPAWRGQGLGTSLAQHLIQQATEPLYLECLGNSLVRFYMQLGFQPIAWRDLPAALQKKFAIAALAATIFRLPVTIMHLQSNLVG